MSDDYYYRLICKGVRPEELREIQNELSRKFRRRPAFRNPFPSEFDSRTVHEIILGVGAASVYFGKKGVDLIVEIVKRKLADRDTRKKNIKIYAPDGSLAVDIIYTPKPPRQ